MDGSARSTGPVPVKPGPYRETYPTGTGTNPHRLTVGFRQHRGYHKLYGMSLFYHFVMDLSCFFFFFFFLMVVLVY